MSSGGSRRSGSSPSRPGRPSTSWVARCGISFSAARSRTSTSSSKPTRSSSRAGSRMISMPPSRPTAASVPRYCGFRRGSVSTSRRRGPRTTKRRARCRESAPVPSTTTSRGGTSRSTRWRCESADRTDRISWIRSEDGGIFERGSCAPSIRDRSSTTRPAPFGPSAMRTGSVS